MIANLFFTDVATEIRFDRARWMSNFSIFKIKHIHDHQIIFWTDVATLGPVPGARI